MRPILLFEDKLGISAGYESIWMNLLLRTGLNTVQIYRRKSYSVFGEQFPLLTRKGNRKQPGFNPDMRIQKILSDWTKSQIELIKPGLVLCMDPALFFIFNPDWDQATSDNLRGGHYKMHGIHSIVMLGISSWHANKREKDIARLNDGFTDKEEWDEEHGGDETDSEMTDIWIEPLSVPYGKFVLEADLRKASRIYKWLATSEKGKS